MQGLLELRLRSASLIPAELEELKTRAQETNPMPGERAAAASLV